MLALAGTTACDTHQLALSCVAQDQPGSEWNFDCRKETARRYLVAAGTARGHCPSMPIGCVAARSCEYATGMHVTSSS